MIPIPPVVVPLVWLLLFVFAVAVIYAVVKWWFEFEFNPKLEKLMMGLVGLIVIVVLIFWVLGLLGFTTPVSSR